MSSATSASSDSMVDVPAASASDTSSSTSALSLSSFHISHLPSGETMHALYLRGLTNAQLQTIKAQSPPHHIDFACMNADLVSTASDRGGITDLFQLECGAVKSSFQALRNKLKTKNIHSEFIFNLGYSSHFQTSIDFLTAKPSSSGVSDTTAKHNILICILHAKEAKLQKLIALLAPLVPLQALTPIQQLRQHCDTKAIVKSFKIVDSELLFTIPAPPSSSAASSSPSLALPNDPLVQAVVGRISLKV